MLDDDNCDIILMQDLINQLNGPFARSRVQIGEGLIEKEDVHVIDHDPAQGNPLLLPARKLHGRGFQQIFHMDELCGPVNLFEDFFLGQGFIFKRKGQVFSSGQADELAVRILQNRPYLFCHSEDTGLCRVQAGYSQGSRDVSGKRAGNQAVDAVGQGALAGAGRTGDQNLFARIYFQIDICNRRFFLGPVFE